MKGEMADAYSYILGELLCALLPLFVDGVLRNTNKKMLSNWSHQNIFAHFLVLTRPKRLLFSNKRKRVKIGQKAFTLTQGDTPLGYFAFQINSSLLEKTTLNENHEFSSYQGKKNLGSLKIKSFLKMGNLISKYPKQKKIKFVTPVLSNKINIFGISRRWSCNSRPARFS